MSLVEMDTDQEALLDLVLSMESNNIVSLPSSFHESETLESDQTPVYTELSNNVFENFHSPDDHLAYLSGFIDMDNLPQVPFSPDAASLPQQSSDTNLNIDWTMSYTTPIIYDVNQSQTSRTESCTQVVKPSCSYQLPAVKSTLSSLLPNVQFNLQTPDSRRYQLLTVSSKPTKPKTRRRVTTASQRKAANVRERRRMFNLNEAFDILRKTVPTFAYEKRLSRIETLRLAMLYITFMADVLSGKQSNDSNFTKLLESVNFAGLTNAGLRESCR
ncbi:uncharacterized protein [Asterias amurensis]|uniref:uncharacterized protein n=1 Tax=Asterias amurensis TaxID=7602 RepID=UPI003AB16CFE